MTQFVCAGQDSIASGLSINSRDMHTRGRDYENSPKP